jgi:predicted TPR repeat methyltransferase
MPTPEEALQNAIAAHNAGRLTEAEVGYSRVLRQQPNDAGALYGLGLLSYHSGSRDKGIQYLMRSLQSAPGNGRAWITLGSMYSETGKAAEALAAYRRATEVAPELADGWYNVGICLKREGSFEAAAQQLRRATACPVPYPQAFEALSALYYERGQLQEAAQTLTDWALREPGNPTAIHMAAAASGEKAPARASDAHVRNLFDAFAAHFDSNLRDLQYQAPELVASALRASSSSATGIPPFGAVLDAGCGTGLCGSLVRDLCRTLVGVDLSKKMLAHAQRRGCYDELQNAELGAFMRSRPRAFDAIVCADTLVYFGDLAEPLAAAHAALRERAPLVFTVESLPGKVAEHRLEISGRYSHSDDYLHRVLRESGFDVASLQPQTLREERGAPVAGYLVVARRLAQP